jgi:hypothetical protein
LADLLRESDRALTFEAILQRCVRIGPVPYRNGTCTSSRASLSIASS